MRLTHSESSPSASDTRGLPAQDPLLALVGPTATGKSAFAISLAREMDAEIVGMDSMQVYRGMDIGTAKPTHEERALVPHACLDLVDPDERFDVSQYLAAAHAAVERARLAGRRALFVGGTGLYLRALVQGLFDGPPIDPALRQRLNARAEEEGSPLLHGELAMVDPSSAARIHPNDRKRVVRALEVFTQSGRALSDWQRQWGWHGTSLPRRVMRLVALSLPAEDHAERCRMRIRAMLEGGWVDEVRAIHDSVGFGPTAIQALGYREVLELSAGRILRADCEDRIARLTRRFVRRQGTWFRSFPGLHWLDPQNETARAEARAVFDGARGSEPTRPSA